MTIIEQNGKLEFQFDGKTSIVSLEDNEEAIRELVRLVENLNRRVAKLERK